MRKNATKIMAVSRIIPNSTSLEIFSVGHLEKSVFTELNNLPAIFGECYLFFLYFRIASRSVMADSSISAVSRSIFVRM